MRQRDPKYFALCALASAISWLPSVSSRWAPSAASILPFDFRPSKCKIFCIRDNLGQSDPKYLGLRTARQNTKSSRWPARSFSLTHPSLTSVACAVLSHVADDVPRKSDTTAADLRPSSAKSFKFGLVALVGQQGVQPRDNNHRVEKMLMGGKEGQFC